MDTEEKIVLAALRQFADHGFSAATTKAIAVEAGVAEVTLFRCFGDKRTLFQRVAEHVAETFGLMEIPNVNTGDLQEDMVILCRGLLHNFIQFNPLFRMLIFEAKKYPYIREVLSQMRGRAFANIRTMIGHTAKAGDSLMADRLEWLANSLMGASLGYCMFHSDEDEDVYVNMHARMIAEAFANSIKTTGK